MRSWTPTTVPRRRIAVAALLAHAPGRRSGGGDALHRLTKDSRQRIAAELDDLNSQLTFT